jgi:D-sedoheptulose 7-phosphate isomerase
MSFENQINEQINLLNLLKSSKGLMDKIDNAIVIIANALKLNKPILICGNGGSASDALHITGELVGRFLKERKALNVICLNSNVSVLTAWSNDYNFETVFSRQVQAHGVEGAILIGLSTSGNSKNILEAFSEANKIGMKCIALTGDGGGKLAPKTDLLIDVPSSSTPRIQELHLAVYHFICQQVEKEF